MKFCAIICEFNPLHKGHVHAIEAAKKATGLPVLCLMSGNFCQRAEPAILEKRIRANHAIECGADVVFELPTIFATGSAETFAKGAIHVLSRLPVSHLVFGSECGNLELLKQAAELSKSLQNSNDVKVALKSGKNYKSAFKEAAQKNNPALADVFEKPNNVLAIEYLKALEGTGILPITIPREDNFLSTQNACSSSAIREAVKTNILENVSCFLPSGVLRDLENAKNPTQIEEHLFFALLTASSEKLCNCPSVSEGLEKRIEKIAKQSTNYFNFLSKATTKRYSKIRLQRVTLENFFGISKQSLKDALESTPTIQLLAKKEGLHFDGFFDKPINLVLKKSDKKLFASTHTLSIDLLAETLFER